MPRGKLAIIGAIVIVIGFLASLSLFAVRETEQVLVLQFGQWKATVQEPGLHYKHFWQSAQKFEKRVLSVDPDAEEVLLIDQKRILVDAFARYRITDPLRFFQTVRSIGSDDQVEITVGLDEFVDHLDRHRRMDVVVHVAVHEQKFANEVLGVGLVCRCLEVVGVLDRVAFHQALILLRPIDVVTAIVVVPCSGDCNFEEFGVAEDCVGRCEPAP